MRVLALLAAAACGKQPHVSVDPGAEAALDAWASAIGGRTRLAAIDGLHATAAVHRDGLDGRSDSWTSARGEMAETSVLGAMSDAFVFDGTHGWVRDTNGEVRAEEAAECDVDRLVAFGETWSPLLTDRLAGSVTAGPNDSVVLATDSDHRMTVTFDATHRPNKLVELTPYGTTIETIEAWREVDGIAVPAQTRTERLGQISTWRADTLEFGAPPAGTFVPPARRSDVSMAGEVRVPIEVSSLGHAFVQVRVGDGAPRWFLLDSGYSTSTIDDAAVRALGLARVGTTTSSGTGGMTESAYVVGVTLHVGGATLANQALGTDDLSPFKQPHDLDGVLGYDFFSRFVVELDYAAGEMRLYDPATYHHTRTGGTELPLSLESDVPRIPVTLDIPGRTIDTHVIFDLGCACELSVSHALTEHEHLLAAFPNGVKSTSIGIGGEASEVAVTMPALHAGSIAFDNVHATLSKNANEAPGLRMEGGLLGVKLASRYLITLDYRDRKVWLDLR